MFGRLNGILFCTLTFFSSCLGSIFLLIPFIPLTFFAPRLWRKIADRLIGYWLTFPASLIFFVFGVKTHVTGDLIERDEPALIIMNHRTRLDWLFFWNALYKMDPLLLTKEKIVLKSSLKAIPGAGWAMSSNSFIFLHRNLALDQRVMESMLKYYKDTKINYQLLLFPEGTDFTQRTAEISNAYADSNGLPRYKFLLHPRTTGFNFILNQMRKNDYIKYVYDVTVGYPRHIVTSEFQLLKEGHFPEEVHFDVRKHTIEEVCGEEMDKNQPVDASLWLTNLWREKEQRLRSFYETDKKFVGGTYAWPVDHFAFAYYVAILFWSMSAIFWIYLMYASFYVKIYVLLGAGLFSWAQWRGGFELLTLEFFYGRRMFLAPNESP